MLRKKIQVGLSFLLLLFSTVKSQDTIPERFLNDFKSYYQTYSTHDIAENLKETYAQENAYAKLNYTFYHKIYYNQPLLEDYIRTVLKQLLPDNAEVDNYEIYITRSTEFNAFTINDGTIFVNIACLAQLSSEAELAFLMAHEYAHYQLEHGKRSFVKKFENKKRKTSLKELQQLNAFSQKNEMASDNLAMVMGTNAVYETRTDSYRYGGVRGELRLY